MDREQLRLLKELMALEFAALDFNLYLDTHPNDQRALTECATLSQQAMVAREQYQQCYGPLTADCAQSGFPWQWIDEPWPWQICYQ